MNKIELYYISNGFTFDKTFYNEEEAKKWWEEMENDGYQVGFVRG